MRTNPRQLMSSNESHAAIYATMKFPHKYAELRCQLMSRCPNIIDFHIVLLKHQSAKFIVRSVANITSDFPFEERETGSVPYCTM